MIIVGSSDVCQLEIPHFYDFLKFVTKNGVVISPPDEVGFRIQAIRTDIDKLTCKNTVNDRHPVELKT